MRVCASACVCIDTLVALLKESCDEKRKIAKKNCHCFCNFTIIRINRKKGKLFRITACCSIPICGKRKTKGKCTQLSAWSYARDKHKKKHSSQNRTLSHISRTRICWRLRLKWFVHNLNWTKQKSNNAALLREIEKLNKNEKHAEMVLPFRTNTQHKQKENSEIVEGKTRTLLYCFVEHRLPLQLTFCHPFFLQRVTLFDQFVFSFFLKRKKIVENFV